MSHFDAFQLGIVAGMLIATFLYYCHHRFELPWRERGIRKRLPQKPSATHEWNIDEAYPLPPPDVMEVLNRQLDREIAAEIRRRRLARKEQP
jgi:hypothetical protein